MKVGWEETKLKEVLTLEYGKPLLKDKRDNNGKYPVYGANGIISKTNQSYYNKKTIIIGRKGSAGEVNLTEEKFWPLDVTYFVTFNEHKHNLLFLYYLLHSLDLPKLARGVKPGINRNEVYEIKIPLPPLFEQQRIVATLDLVFITINKIKTNTERNLKNARELFESYLQSVFENRHDKWEERSLEQIIQKTETVDPTKKPNDKFVYLDVSSVNKENKEIENVTVILGKNAPRRARRIIKTGDVIFATVRPTHSRVAIISEKYDQQVCSTGYFIFRTKKFLKNNLLFYFVLTPSFKEKMEKLQKGASYPAVTDKDIKSVLISFPQSLFDQQNIVRKLDTLWAQTKRLEMLYQQKLEDLEKLKKSILRQAFNGELKIDGRSD